MYPTIKKKKKKSKIKKFFSIISDDSKSFLSSFKSPRRLFRYIKKSFHF